MSKRLLCVILAAVVAAALAGRAEPETVSKDFRFCQDKGGDECVHIWKFKCPAANTKIVRARVCPRASGSEAFFNVAIVGKTPPALLGKGDIDAAAYEACTQQVYLVRPTPGPITGYVNVSRWNDIGPTGSGEYGLSVSCVDEQGSFTTDATLEWRTSK